MQYHRRGQPPMLACSSSGQARASQFADSGRLNWSFNQLNMDMQAARHMEDAVFATARREVPKQCAAGAVRGCIARRGGHKAAVHARLLSSELVTAHEALAVGGPRRILCNLPRRHFCRGIISQLADGHVRVGRDGHGSCGRHGRRTRLCRWQLLVVRMEAARGFVDLPERAVPVDELLLLVTTKTSTRN
jgi:hypothetical protein